MQCGMSRKPIALILLLDGCVMKSPGALLPTTWKGTQHGKQMVQNWLHRAPPTITQSDGAFLSQTEVS